MAIIWTQKSAIGRLSSIPKGTDVHIRMSKDISRPLCRISFYDWAGKKYAGKYVNVGYDPERPNRLYFLATDDPADGFRCSNEHQNNHSLIKMPVRAIESAFGGTVRAQDLVGDYALRTDVALKLSYIEFTR